MGKIFRFSRRFIFLVVLVLTINTSRAQGSVSFQVFYDQLAPYGSWVNYNQYGYVWIPTSVDRGFRPYGSAGHWVLTPDGWTWISNYSWGWAPFHYGNWFYDDVYGWMWMPGYDWAPAWVTWGESGGNYCWAPIGPNIQIAAAWNSYRPPVYYWTFMPRTYMGRSNMNNYYVHYNTNVTVVKNITVINNIHSGGGGRAKFMRGPQAGNVERYTHSTIKPVTIRESTRPGRVQVQNGQAVIYRPSINRPPAGRPVAPSRVQNIQSVKPANLPGYNRNIRQAARPANGNRPARPAPNPASARPAPANRSRPSNPAPNRQPVKPAPESHPVPAASPHSQTARPAPPARQAPKSAPPAHTVRPPQTPHTVPQRRQPVRPEPQETPRQAPQHPENPSPRQAPRPAPRQPAPRTAPQQPAHHDAPPARPARPENKPEGHPATPERH